MLRATLFCVFMAVIAACGSSPVASPVFPAEEWRYEDGLDPYYLFAPGDTIEVVVHTAPELSRELVIAPDGRIRMPLAGPVDAAARTPDEVRASLIEALGTELKDPDLDIVATEFASQQIFVGGEVSNEGMFELPGQIDPLQAIVMAGGFTPEARQREVVVMRRLPGGDVRTAVLDLAKGFQDPGLAAWVPLRRFDVVYVPQSRIAKQNQFIEQYVRNALPIQFSLFYDVSGNNSR